MPTVRFTRHLARYFPNLGDNITVSGETVSQVVARLDQMHPGLAAYIVDDTGALRRHVNIFLNQELIADRQQLQDPVADADQLYIFQALSGG